VFFSIFTPRIETADEGTARIDHHSFGEALVIGGVECRKPVPWIGISYRIATFAE
jgi:hypothetical protein